MLKKMWNAWKAQFVKLAIMESQMNAVRFA